MCLQLYSSSVSFVWQPAHFEFERYGTMLQKNSHFSKKRAIILRFLAIKVKVLVVGKVFMYSK